MDSLTSLLAYSQVDLDLLVSLLGSAFVPKRHIVILDGIDECSKDDQAIILKAFKDLLNSSPHLHVFMTGREGLTPLVMAVECPKLQISTRDSRTKAAVATYIDLSIGDAHESGQLQVGGENLVDTIKDALKKGAEDM